MVCRVFAAIRFTVLSFPPVSLLSAETGQSSYTFAPVFYVFALSGSKHRDLIHQFHLILASSPRYGRIRREFLPDSSSADLRLTGWYSPSHLPG